MPFSSKKQTYRAAMCTVAFCLSIGLVVAGISASGSVIEGLVYTGVILTAISSFALLCNAMDFYLKQNSKINRASLSLNVLLLLGTLCVGVLLGYCAAYMGVGSLLSEMTLGFAGTTCVKALIGAVFSLPIAIATCIFVNSYVERSNKSFTSNVIFILSIATGTSVATVFGPLVSFSLGLQGELIEATLGGAAMFLFLAMVYGTYSCIHDNLAHSVKPETWQEQLTRSLFLPMSSKEII